MYTPMDLSVETKTSQSVVTTPTSQSVITTPTSKPMPISITVSSPYKNSCCKNCCERHFECLIGSPPPKNYYCACWLLNVEPEKFSIFNSNFSPLTPSTTQSIENCCYPLSNVFKTFEARCVPDMDPLRRSSNLGPIPYPDSPKYDSCRQAIYQSISSIPGIVPENQDSRIPTSDDSITTFDCVDGTKSHTFSQPTDMDDGENNDAQSSSTLSQNFDPSLNLSPEQKQTIRSIVHRLQDLSDRFAYNAPNYPHIHQNDDDHEADEFQPNYGLQYLLKSFFQRIIKSAKTVFIKLTHSLRRAYRRIISLIT